VITDSSTARGAPIGSRVGVRGTVIAGIGLIGGPRLVAIGDAGGGIVVKLPDGVVAPVIGADVEVVGPLAEPYGQLEIRPDAAGFVTLGNATPPDPIEVGPAGLEERHEARLVTVSGRVAKRPTRSGDAIVVVLERAGQASIRVMAATATGLTVASFEVGGTYALTGVVGQRASRKGAQDGYRLWLRTAADVVRSAGSTPGSSGGSGGSSSGPTASPALPVIAISRTSSAGDGRIAIAGTVTGPATLLDATGRRIVIQDATGALEVLIPSGSTAPPLGARVRAEGKMGVAYGAPRLRADTLVRTGAGAAPQALVLHAEPRATHEWRLVRVKGRIDEVRKLGDRWRAELVVGSTRVVIIGQPGAAVPRDVLVVGQTATITGIVRRPYPTAADQRFTILPRFPADVVVTPGPKRGGPAASSPPGGPASGQGPDGASLPTTIDVDLSTLDAHVGASVRVGGLVTDLRPDGVLIDDGTATGRIVLLDAAIELLPLLEPDDAINAIGAVEIVDGTAAVVVHDPAGILRIADPGAGRTPAEAGSSPEPSTGTGATARIAGLGEVPGLGGPGPAGLAALLAISIVSVLVTLLRRHHAHRMTASRIASRIGALTSPAGSVGAPQPPSVAPVRVAAGPEHERRSQKRPRQMR
jgi:hypothetical protein